MFESMRMNVEELQGSLFPTIVGGPTFYTLEYRSVTSRKFYF